MRGMRLRWGSIGTAADAAGVTSGSLAEAILFVAYLIVWSLTAAVFIGVFILAAVATLVVVLVCMPCFLWSKVLLKDKSQTSGHNPKARLPQD